MSAGYLRKCARKAQHETKNQAEDARRSMVRVGKWTLNGSNTYRCNQCGHWHAGRVGTRFRGKGKGK
jgi:rubrerythrin